MAFRIHNEASMCHECGSCVAHVNESWLFMNHSCAMTVDYSSSKFQVTFAKEPYKRDDILQKRPVILRSLLTTLFLHSHTHPQGVCSHSGIVVCVCKVAVGAPHCIHDPQWGIHMPWMWSMWMSDGTWMRSLLQKSPTNDRSLLQKSPMSDGTWMFSMWMSDGTWMRHSWMRHGTFSCALTNSCAPWHIYVCHNKSMCIMTHLCVPWRIRMCHDAFMCAMTNSCVPWHMHVCCAMTHSCVLCHICTGASAGSEIVAYLTICKRYLCMRMKICMYVSWWKKDIYVC